MDINNINFRKYKNDLLFIPLGGSNEIGLNCNLYHCNGKWIIIDCGIGFVKTLPGVEVLIPDIDILRKIQKDTLGIFITHAHEDHLGAIQYVWQNIQVPIYTSRFTKLFLQEKLKEYDFYNQVVINEINESEKMKLGPFEIEFIGLTHSTPEMNAMIIKTEKGNILHSGDWKFDNNPVIGNKSDIKRLKKMGDRGEILASVCESTNVFNDNEPQNESELFDSFYSIIKNKKGAVIFTTFASNVSRIKTIMDVAKKTKRKIAIVGNSLYRIIDVARNVGYITDKYEIIAENEIKDCKKSNLLLIATGCQGNYNAGIDKIANDAYRYMRIGEKDVVIFSSKIIPGNEKEIIALYNKLAEKDVEVITEKNDFVHVSGHYCVSDLKKFYNYVKPKIAIAVHGDPMHLQEHQRIARSCGIKATAKGKNGIIMKITENKVEKVGQINVKCFVVDGKRLLSARSDVLKDRAKMEEVGVVCVSLIVDTKYRNLKNPIIFTPGGYDSKDKAMEEIIIEDILKMYRGGVAQIMEAIRNKKNKFVTNEEKENFLAQKVRTAVNKVYFEDLGKKPLIEVKFTVINKENVSEHRD